MKKTAVIVEDNKALAETFKLVLESAIGLETHVIHDGQAASEYLAQVVPDILLLDLHLPYMSGQEIIEQLAQDPLHSNTNIVVATADVFLGDDFKKTYPTVSEVIFKPVSVKALVQTIKSNLPHS